MFSANALWSLWLILQGPMIKQYPSKLRLTTLQCFFSCIQSAFWAIANERDPSAWKLGWDTQLLSVVYCVQLSLSLSLFSMIITICPRKKFVFVDTKTLVPTKVFPGCDVINCAWQGVVVTAISYWLQVWAIEKKGPVFTAMFTPVALVIAALVSAFLWKETLFCGSVVGATLMVGGLYFVLWGKMKEDGNRKEVKDDPRPDTKEEATSDCIPV